MFSLPIQSHHIFKSAVIRSNDLLVFFFSVVFSATRPRPSLGHTKDRRESRNVLCLFAKAVETLLHEQYYGYVKYILFSFYSFLFALDLKRIINTLKRY